MKKNKLIKEKYLFEYYENAELLKKVPDYLDDSVKDKLRKESVNEEQLGKNAEISTISKKNINPFFGFVFAASILILIVFSILLFNYYLNKGDYIAFNYLDIKPAYITGNVYLKNSSLSNLSLNSKISLNDKIGTGEFSECLIVVNKEHSINIKEKSEIKINSGKSNNDLSLIKIELMNGTIFIDSNKMKYKKSFTVKILNFNCEIAGAKVVIRKDKSSIEIIVIDGFIKLKHFIHGIMKIYLLNKNDSIIIHNNNVQNRVLSDKELSELIKTDSEYTEQVEKNIETKDEDKNNLNETDLNIIEKTIYNTNDIDGTSIDNNLPEINESDKSDCLVFGFTFSNEFAFYSNEKSIFCITKKGDIIWENNYYKEQSIKLNSAPIYFNDKVFVISNNNVIAINALSGKEIIQVTAPESFLSNSLNVVNSNLYIMCNQGIYKFDMIKIELIKQPIIETWGKVFASFSEELIVTTNDVSRELNAYSLNGERLWYADILAVCNFPPLITSNSIFASDTLGYIYKYSKSGKKEKHVLLPETIISNLTIYDNFILTICNNNKFYKINIDNLEIIFDISFEPGRVLNEDITVFNNIAIVSNTSGELFIINLQTGNLDNIIKLSDNSIGCPVYFWKDIFLTGAVDGKIFLIDKADLTK